MKYIQIFFIFLLFCEIFHNNFFSKVLSDEAKRKLYDRCGEECVKKEGMMDGGELRFREYKWEVATLYFQEIPSPHSSETLVLDSVTKKEETRFIKVQTWLLIFMQAWKRCTVEISLR